jgi:catechol 2,3-dioxygenase-like lactoylglutathione lyase family enzyme
MTLEHVALWTPNVERARQFYGDYFGAVATGWYRDSARQVSAYLLSFANGARLELLQPAKLLAAGRGPVVGYRPLSFRQWQCDHRVGLNRAATSGRLPDYLRAGLKCRGPLSKRHRGPRWQSYQNH